LEDLRRELEVRIAIGGFGAESNAFSVESPVTKAETVLVGGELVSKNLGNKTVIGGFLDVLAEAKVEIIPTQFRLVIIQDGKRQVFNIHVNAVSEDQHHGNGNHKGQAEK